MSYGIKISKPGVDVKTAANKDLVLTSEKNMFKVKQSGSVSYTFNGTEGGGTTVLATINHGLGYKPAVTVFVYDHTEDEYTHLALNFSFGPGAFREWIGYEITTNDLIIYYNSEGGPPNDYSPNEYTFKYYIMYDEGA
jgi:hypothetical protein